MAKDFESRVSRLEANSQRQFARRLTVPELIKIIQREIPEFPDHPTMEQLEAVARDEPLPEK